MICFRLHVSLQQHSSEAVTCLSWGSAHEFLDSDVIDNMKSSLSAHWRWSSKCWLSLRAEENATCLRLTKIIPCGVLWSVCCKVSTFLMATWEDLGPECGSLPTVVYICRLELKEKHHQQHPYAFLRLIHSWISSCQRKNVSPVWGCPSYIVSCWTSHHLVVKSIHSSSQLE